jgi:hypothetical protein
MKDKNIGKLLKLIAKIMHSGPLNYNDHEIFESQDIKPHQISQETIATLTDQVKKYLVTQHKDNLYARFSDVFLKY